MTGLIDEPHKIQQLLPDRSIRLKGEIEAFSAQTVSRPLGRDIQKVRPAMAQERRIPAEDDLRRLCRCVFGFVLVG